MIIGPGGAPWIADGGLNAIVRVDPASLEVRVFPLPAGRAGANLSTAVFDGNASRLRISVSLLRSTTGTCLASSSALPTRLSVSLGGLVVFRFGTWRAIRVSSGRACRARLAWPDRS